jgi:GNAT superfamily N-acetyltransferase
MVSTFGIDITDGITLAWKRHRAVVHASRGATWNLALLATAPEHCGKGLARALLQRQLRAV